MTSDINNPLVSHSTFCSQWSYKDGASSYITRCYAGGSKKLEGGHISLLRQRQNIEEDDSTVQGKTKHTPT